MASQLTLDRTIACITNDQVMKWIARAVLNISTLTTTMEILARLFTAAFDIKTPSPSNRAWSEFQVLADRSLDAFDLPTYYTEIPNTLQL